MKIKDIELFFVKIPVIPTLKGGIAPYRGHDCPPGQGLEFAESCLVKLYTDDGITGWGEANIIMNPVVQKSLFEDYIRPLVIGQDCFSADAFISKAAKSFEPPIGIRGVLTAVDIACMDIMGKAFERPVYSLLGGKIRSKVEIAYCQGLEDFACTRDRIAMIKEMGYLTYKTTGGQDLYSDIERARVIREAAGDTMNIRVDMNEAYDLISAVRYFTAINDFGFEYVEQPLRVNDFDGFGSLRKRFATPVAINEDSYIPNNLYEYAKRDAIDAAVVDMDPCGGISQISKVADFSEAIDLSLIHHCGFDLGIKTAAILQVYAAKFAFSRAMDSVYMELEDDILCEKLKIKDGSFVIPDLPGLGIEVAEEKVRRYSFFD